MNVLIISADLVEDSEFQVPYQNLKELGHHVDIASLFSYLFILKVKMIFRKITL